MLKLVPAEACVREKTFYSIKNFDETLLLQFTSKETWKRVPGVCF